MFSRLTSVTLISAIVDGLADMPRKIAVLVCLLSLSGISLAGSFHVSPVRVELSAQESSSILNVENNGESAVTIQLTMLSWTQQDGKDKLLSTRDVIATPPVFNIKAGATQLVRIGLLRKPDNSKELSYRLFLEEIPPPPAPDFKGLQVALRIGIPLFVKPEKEARQNLQFSLNKKSDGTMQVLIANPGMAHAQIFNLNVYSIIKPDRALGSVDTSMYLLPGQERGVQLTTGDFSTADVGPFIVKAQTRAGPVESHASISTPN